MEIENNNQSVEYLTKQIEKTISSQKVINQISFFQRNKKLIIVISLLLIALIIVVNIYAIWGINYAYTNLK